MWRVMERDKVMKTNKRIGAVAKRVERLAGRVERLAKRDGRFGRTRGWQEATAAVRELRRVVAGRSDIDNLYQLSDEAYRANPDAWCWMANEIDEIVMMEVE